MTPIPLRLAVQQRVLPAYRVPFFNCLADECEGGLSVCAGLPRPGENILAGDLPSRANYYQARNRHLLGGSLYACLQTNLLSWLESWHPDVLVIEANPRYLSTPRAIQWMKARGKAVVGWGLGSPAAHGLLSKWVEARRRHLVVNLDAVITYSRQGADEYKMLGVPGDRIFVARNAVAHRPDTEPPARPPVFSGERPLLIFVGRLQERKRVDLLLHACAALPEQLQPELTIVGDGPDRSRLEHIASQHYPRTCFTGSQTGKPLDDLLRQADLFVLPGTGGLALQQAMSHALPVIAGEADGTQTDLVRPDNGWRIIPGELQSLRSTLLEALADPPRLRRMGLRSYEIVRDEINLEQMVSSFMEAVRFAREGAR